MDVTSSASVELGVAACVAALGRLDVVVNNAGVTIVGAVHELTEDEWDRELAANLKSVYLVSKAAWPHLEARGGGAILDTASIAGHVGDPRRRRVLRVQGRRDHADEVHGARRRARQGIRVNCVCPGFTETPMIEGYFADQPDPEAARAFATGDPPARAARQAARHRRRVRLPRLRRGGVGHRHGARRRRRPDLRHLGRMTGRAPARAEVVGSLLRPARLRAAVDELYEPGHSALLDEERARDRTRLSELEDEAILEAVRRQRRSASTS